MHIDQFERTAAKVADNAVRFMDSGHNAERSEMRLTLSREDCDCGAADAFGLRDEGTAIARVPAGGRGDGPDAPHVQNIAQGAEASERVERRIDGVRRQQAGRLHLTPETGQHFFIEDGRRGAGQPFVDNKTD